MQNEQLVDVAHEMKWKKYEKLLFVCFSLGSPATNISSPFSNAFDKHSF